MCLGFNYSKSSLTILSEVFSTIIKFIMGECNNDGENKKFPGKYWLACRRCI